MPTTSTYRKEMEEPELVFSEEANQAIPQMVIKFYESKLTWNEVPDEEQGVYILPPLSTPDTI